jgi:hypothetical protein
MQVAPRAPEIVQERVELCPRRIGFGFAVRETDMSGKEEQRPQSVGQVKQLSSGSQIPLPHEPGDGAQVPQSTEQLSQVSPNDESQNPSPQ